MDLDKNPSQKHQGQPVEDQLTLIKFRQDNPENQLAFWHRQKQFSTSLKFVDFMAEHNLAFSSDLYHRIQIQKVFFNFNTKKRFLVAKDIVSRYLVPLHQVILLFSFAIPEAYFQ